MIEERAILAALERIARMQDSIRSGMDICRDTGLVFLRVYYEQLPPNVARRLTELHVCVHHIGLRAVHHRNAVQYQRQSRLVGKMPHVRGIRHSRAVVGNGQRRIAEGGGFGSHFI